MSQNGDSLALEVFTDPIVQLAAICPICSLAALKPAAALSALSPTLAVFNPAINPRAAALSFALSMKVGRLAGRNLQLLGASTVMSQRVMVDRTAGIAGQLMAIQRSFAIRNALATAGGAIFEATSRGSAGAPPGAGMGYTGQGGSGRSSQVIGATQGSYSRRI